MSMRMVVGLLFVVLLAQLIARWSNGWGSADYTTTERAEPSRLLSGDLISDEVLALIPVGPAERCRVVIFGSPTCPGCAALATAWDHQQNPQRVWILDGEADGAAEFVAQFGLQPETTVHLPEGTTLSELGIFATPTWGFVDGAGRIWHVRGSSQPPDPSVGADVCG